MDRIRFQNYRCFSDTGNVDLKPLTFLLGANSSGKSSFLKFFPLLKQSVGLRRNGLFLWYANYVDFKDFGNAVKKGEDSITISWEYDDFLVNDIRSFSRLKKILNTEKLSRKINLRLSMEISARRDNFDKLDKLEIEFLEERVELMVEESGNVLVKVNDRIFTYDNMEIRFGDTTYLLPRLYISYDTTDGIMYNASFSKIFDKEKLFEDESLKDLQETIQSEGMIYLNKEGYTAFFKHFVNNDYFDYDYLRDFYILANLDEIIETINYRIQAEVIQFSYVKPLRVMPERYYRYQNYSVDEIDSDGKNLAMFLANLSEAEMKQYQQWTAAFFGFRIYAAKHEGHVELTIGSTKKEARNLVDVGFGYTQLLPIVTIIWNALKGRNRFYYYARVGKPQITLAIEQPELHLHPKVQSEFAEFLGKVVEKLSSNVDVRFIIETHSEAIINRVGSMIQSGNLAKDKVNVVLFNGVKEGMEDYVVESEFDDEGYLTNWPLGFFL